MKGVKGGRDTTVRECDLFVLEEGEERRKKKEEKARYMKLKGKIQESGVWLAPAY